MRCASLRMGSTASARALHMTHEIGPGPGHCLAPKPLQDHAIARTASGWESFHQNQHPCVYMYM